MSLRFLSLLVFGIFIGLIPAVDAAPPHRIGLIWWPADPANPANPFIESFQKCLGKQLVTDCPEIITIPPISIRDALFPLFEPATQPTSEEAFVALLTRDDVHSRLAKHMDFLVAFTGGTAKEDKGGIVCGGGYGAGGCLGFAWINKNTQVSAVIWDLQRPDPPSHYDSSIEGTTWIPAFILPIPLPAPTESEACRDMSKQIVEFILSRPQ